MKRAAIIGAAVLVVGIVAALITTSANKPPKEKPVIMHNRDIRLRDPFRPDHPTREEWEKGKGASAPAGAVTKKDEE